ncbi:DUF6402 family protein [Herbaspirillum sp. VT-16-41]|uniref:DUF6402 family protein n=1 Tax=Herbaspirillum sp. VT-16-41 TaxID=1953765 RepID=UPI0011157D9B|nr:DUF6402 family protein [Herbaspirillum sp. VT-16-41]
MQERLDFDTRPVIEESWVNSKARKQPYYRLASSSLPFAKPAWKLFSGLKGCVPLVSEQTVSMSRPAPGEVLPADVTPSAIGGSRPNRPGKREADRQKTLARQLEKQKPLLAPGDSQAKARAAELLDPGVFEAEHCDELPAFDMLDIPDAMENMGWPVSARLARKWFSSPELVWDKTAHADLPVDDSITLNWVRRFGVVEWKYRYLLERAIYTPEAKSALKFCVENVTQDAFRARQSLAINTATDLTNLPLFHKKWQFQHMRISNYETIGRDLAMTDLAAALANFSICVAVGRVEVVGEKYYQYDNLGKTKTFCMNPSIRVTHVYVYVRDNYSFNDHSDSETSQYLGHWNKTGMLVFLGGMIGDWANHVQEFVKAQANTASPVDLSDGSVRLHNRLMGMPVDRRTGLFSKFRRDDVHYPIFNKSFNEWRTKHHRGGDFWIFSKPQCVRLEKPIHIALRQLCRDTERM